MYTNLLYDDVTIQFSSNAVSSGIIYVSHRFSDEATDSKVHCRIYYSNGNQKIFVIIEFECLNILLVLIILIECHTNVERVLSFVMLIKTYHTFSFFSPILFPSHASIYILFFSLCTKIWFSI
jgi:hypothetical protein